MSRDNDDDVDAQGEVVRGGVAARLSRDGGLRRYKPERTTSNLEV